MWLFLLNQNKHGYAFIKWKEFICYLDIDLFNEGFWFTKGDPFEVSYKANTFLNITNSSKILFWNHYYVCEKDEIQRLEQLFHGYLNASKYETEFIIPMESLRFVEADNIQTSKISNHLHGSKFICEIRSTPRFFVYFDFFNFIQNIDQIVSLHQNGSPIQN